MSEIIEILGTYIYIQILFVGNLVVNRIQCAVHTDCSKLIFVFKSSLTQTIPAAASYTVFFLFYKLASVESQLHLHKICAKMTSRTQNCSLFHKGTANTSQYFPKKLFVDSFLVKLPKFKVVKCIRIYTKTSLKCQIYTTKQY